MPVTTLISYLTLSASLPSVPHRSAGVLYEFCIHISRDIERTANGGPRYALIALNRQSSILLSSESDAFDEGLHVKTHDGFYYLKLQANHYCRDRTHQYPKETLLDATPTGHPLTTPSPVRMRIIASQTTMRRMIYEFASRDTRRVTEWEK